MTNDNAEQTLKNAGNMLYNHVIALLKVEKAARDLISPLHHSEYSPEEKVNHPKHYGGAENPYEAIKVIEAWGLGFCLGNTVKYISRAGKKADNATVQDLKKAQWYLEREIKRMEANAGQ